VKTPPNNFKSEDISYKEGGEILCLVYSENTFQIDNDECTECTVIAH
jgi:hypothetical protein